MRRDLAKLKREFAEFQERASAQLCTCGKSRSGTGVPRIELVKTCADRKRIDEAESVPRARCPAMHPNGDAEPLIVRVNFYGCRDPACECHKNDECGSCGVTEACKPPIVPSAVYAPPPHPVLEESAGAEPAASTQTIEATVEVRPTRPMLSAPDACSLCGYPHAGPVCDHCGCDALHHEAWRDSWLCVNCGKRPQEHVKHRNSACGSYRAYVVANADTCLCRRCPGFALPRLLRSAVTLGRNRMPASMEDAG